MVNLIVVMTLLLTSVFTSLLAKNIQEGYRLFLCC